MPGTVYMTQLQMSDYLNDLRTHKIVRPTGSRPYPGSSLRRQREPIPLEAPNHRYSLSDRFTDPPRLSKAGHRRSLGALPITTISAEEGDDTLSKQSAEKARLEAVLNLTEDEEITFAAREQANDLIHKHENPDAPYRLDDKAQPSGVSNNCRLEDKIVIAKRGTDNASRPNPEEIVLRKRSSYAKLAGLWHPSSITQRRRSSGQRRISSGKHKAVFENIDDKIYEDPSERVRKSSGATEKAEPAQTVPEQAAVMPVASAVPAHVRRNPFLRSRRSVPVVQEATSTSAPDPSLSRSATEPKPELHRTGLPVTSASASSVDTRYRNGIEVRSDDLRAATSFRRSDRSAKLPTPTAVSDTAKRPIVSFQPDWTPPKPREQPVRPDLGRATPEIRVDDAPEPVKSASAPIVPTIGHPMVPSIQLNNGRLVTDSIMIQAPELRPSKPGSVPAINISSSDHETPSNKVSCTIDEAGTRSKGPANRSAAPNGSLLDRRRPHPVHAATAPAQLRTPWPLSGTGQNGALCGQCALPISGKSVTAADTRFHPHCFACFTCGEQLECVDFYPEPSDKREERLERIAQRLSGELEEDERGGEEDGDDSLRFYCHLDFHEKFSPRCKSCKTPIEGEVVVACGAEWHVGHFFCAECGDPFEASTPFVERDGYAWCIKCHTRRYSSKCRGCRQPVTDTVIKALDAEWHAECFVCSTCNGPFDDARFFLVGDSQDPVCFTCESRRLKGVGTLTRRDA